MATTYSYEKGKYGGPCGTIFPYFRPMENLSPLDQEYADNIPAGYLRCRGQVLNADQYPNLALIIGIGETCIYRKSGITLQNANSDGTGGQIQLPDLGSKYITAATTPGSYLNTTTTNTATNTEVSRSGIAVELSSNASSSGTLSFTYEGDFVLNQKELPVSGQVRATGPSSTTRRSVSESEIMGHGHGSTLSTGSLIIDGLVCFVAANRTGGIFCQPQPATIGGSNIPTGRAWSTFTTEPFGSDELTSHSHSGLFPSVTSSSSSASIRRTQIPASGITTTVTFNKFNRFSIDRVSGKFILCEYLIKF